MNRICAILILLIVSCNSSKKGTNKEYRIVRFTGKSPEGSKSIVQDYLIDVPRGGKLIKGRGAFTYHAHSEEYRIIYPDSSILYIGNDNWRGSRLNIINRYNNGTQGIYKKGVTDTLYFEGTQLDGRYWKENILNDVVVGYVNIRLRQKNRFDKAVQSIRPYKKP